MRDQDTRHDATIEKDTQRRQAKRPWVTPTLTVLEIPATAGGELTQFTEEYWYGEKDLDPSGG